MTVSSSLSEIRSICSWLVLLLCLGAAAFPAFAAQDGTAQLPPMGWRSWNFFQCNIDQKTMEAVMDAVVDRSRLVNGKPTSLADLGYIDVGLDDCWQQCNSGPTGFHDANGNPIVNTQLFPDMKSMVDYAHQRGLRAGWYGNNCQCSDKCSDLKCFQGDVDALVSFGYDSYKIDGCGAERNIGLWYQLLNATGHHVMVENCGNGPKPNASWCPYHMYRSSDDVRPVFGSVLNNLQSTIQWATSGLSGPGCWAYPDMLEVGNTNGQSSYPVLTHTEARSHFGAWCIVSSPLILGLDVLNSTSIDAVWDIITNTEAISINQQWAGFAGSVCMQSNETTHFNPCDWEGDACDMPNWQVFYKPLEVPYRSTAVLVMNNSPQPLDLTVPFSSIPNLECGGSTCRLRDVWNHLDLGPFTNQFSVTALPSHDSAFFIVMPLGETQAIA